MLKVITIVLMAFALYANSSYAAELKVGSWGGNIRSGPSTDYPKIDSLKNGDPVVLLKKIKTNGTKFNWFKIAYDGGKIGYQWGGILCGFKHKVSGTFGICEKNNRSTPRTYECANQNHLRSLGSKRKTKITFIVGQTKNRFKVYWLDYNGKKNINQNLTEGMSWTVETYPSHPWAVYKVLASGSETCHSVVRGTKNPSQWLLR